MSRVGHYYETSLRLGARTGLLWSRRGTVRLCMVTGKAPVEQTGTKGISFKP